MAGDDGAYEGRRTLHFPIRISSGGEIFSHLADYQVFADQCNCYLGAIMDGCDVPNGNSNPMNWNHGGSMKDNNEVIYTILNANRAPAPGKPLGSCKSRYKGF